MRVSGDIPTGSFALGRCQGSSSLGSCPVLQGELGEGRAGESCPHESKRAAPESLGHWWLQ